MLACHEAGIEVIVKKSVTSSAKADGRFDKADFIYDAATNEFQTRLEVTQSKRGNAVNF